MSVFQSDAFLICLLASLIWAPFVHCGASLLDRRRSLMVSEKIWLAALAAAVLPAMLTPAFSSAGISLRTMPAIERTPQDWSMAAPVVDETTSIRPVVVETAAASPIVAADPAPVIVDNPAQIAAPFKAHFAIDFLSSLSLQTIVDIAGLLYVYGALLALGLWLMRRFGFALTTLRATPVADPALIAAVMDWRDRMGVRRKVRIKTSRNIASVCVTGYAAPVILIPADIRRRVSFADLEMMCAHELAHIKRGDVRLFTIGAAARILFWFNPFIKRIAARAELAAEQCADDLVVSSGVSRRAYAACFVEGLRFAAKQPSQAFAALPSFTPFDRKGRRKRLESILTAPARVALPIQTKFLLGAAGLIAASAIFAQAAVAVSPQIRDNEEGVLTLAPVNGRLTLAHGVQWKDTKTGAIKGPHQGVDIAAKRGTDIVAPGAGIVIEATDLYLGNPQWGKVIVIDHGADIKTRYAHLDSYGVMKGDRVWAGDIIGKVGSTGRSSGPHLHFETIIGGKTVDPLTVLDVDVEDFGRPSPVAPYPAPAAEPDAAPEPTSSPKPVRATYLDQVLAGPPSAFSEWRMDIITDAFDEASETFDDLRADLEDIMDEDVSDDVQEAIDAATTRQSIQRRSSRQIHSVFGGEDMDHAARSKMEQALTKMRAQMHAARKDREKARRKAHEARREALHTHKRAEQKKQREHRLANSQTSRHRHLSYDYEYQTETQDRVLEMRNHALENARRSLTQAHRQIEQSLAQAERSLDQSETSMRLKKLPKKDFERFKRHLDTAREDLQEQKSERLQALRDAEQTIEAQQQEINQLRKELADQERTIAAN